MGTGPVEGGGDDRLRVEDAGRLVEEDRTVEAELRPPLHRRLGVEQLMFDAELVKHASQRRRVARLTVVDRAGFSDELPAGLGSELVEECAGAQRHI